MQTILEATGASIFTFKQGDIIFRTKPARIINPPPIFSFCENLYQKETQVDNSYRDPMEFLNIKNNLIYIRKHKSLCSKGEQTVFAPISPWPSLSK